MFALKNTKIDDEADDAVKITITKRAQHFINEDKKLQKSQSCTNVWNEKLVIKNIFVILLMQHIRFNINYLIGKNHSRNICQIFKDIISPWFWSCWSSRRNLISWESSWPVRNSCMSLTNWAIWQPIAFSALSSYHIIISDTLTSHTDNICWFRWAANTWVVLSSIWIFFTIAFSSFLIKNLTILTNYTLIIKLVCFSLALTYSFPRVIYFIGWARSTFSFHFYETLLTLTIIAWRCRNCSWSYCTGNVCEIVWKTNKICEISKARYS